MVSQINSTKQLANNTTLNPSQNHSVTIRAGLSQAFHNKDLKPGHTQAAFGNSFQSVEINLKQLVEHITGGGAFTMGHFSSSNRKGENFVSAQLLALDLDENISVEQALSCDLIRHHALLAHPSASSTPAHRKTRVLFRLDEPITDRHAWERLQRGLIHHFAHLKPDDACKDAARMFYGSTNTSDQVYINYAAHLPLEQAEAMAAHREAEEEAYLRAISEREGPKVKVSGTRAEKYAAATLDNLLTELRSTTSSRHDTLIRVGTSLFAMAASGEWPGIDDATVERELQAACAANGYTAKRGQGEIQRCINDARRYGHSAPRPLELPEKSAQHQAAGETPVDPHQAFKKRWKRCETQLAGLMPRADETIHQPYVGTIPDGDVLLDSPLGTGKTTAGKKLAESTSSILTVNDRRTLTRALAKHMGLDHYEHFEGPQAGAIRSSDKLAITVDSLHRLKDARPPEVLYLEEIDFILRQFSAATMKDENRDANMAALVDQIGNAGRVVAVQANISPVACAYIKYFRPDIRLVSNTHRPDRGDVTFVTDHPAGIIHTAVNIAGQGGLAVITSDSRTELQAIELYAREQGAGVDFDIYVIHGWKSQEPETAWLINNINLIIKAAAQKGRGVLLLISPSAAVGFNVDGKVADDDPPVEFDLVGVVGRNVVTPDTLAQMMMRIRHAKQYLIYVGGFDPEHLETDKEVILERQRKELLKTAQLAEFDKHGISSLTEMAAVCMRISAAYTAWDNLQRKDMLGFTAAHLARAGFNPVLNTDKTPVSVIQEYRLMRERWKAHAEQMKRTIPAVNKDLFEKLRKQGQLTEAHYFGRERDRIEKAAGGRDINQEGIFERFGTPKKRGRIYRAERLNRPLEDAQQADREEAIKLPQHRGHYTQEHLFLMDAWQVLLKREVRDFNQSLELLQDHEFDEADLERLLSYCIEHGFEAACKILGYTCSLDINSPDVNIRRRIASGLFHALLRVCRLQAEGKQHRPTINGKRVSHRTYIIPFDVLLLLEQDLACLEAYREREQEQERERKQEREQTAVYKFRDDALTPSEFVDTFEPDLVLDGLDEQRRAQMAAVPF